MEFLGISKDREEDLFTLDELLNMNDWNKRIKKTSKRWVNLQTSSLFCKLFQTIISFPNTHYLFQTHNF